MRGERVGPKLNMSNSLLSKRILLTGCAANIGRATALLFAREGAQLVLVDRDPAAERTATEAREFGVNVKFLAADVSSVSEVVAMFQYAEQTLGGLDVIVNNAGVQRAGAIADLAEEDWDSMMRVNPRSCFLSCKYGLPLLERAGGGVIVNMASLAAFRGAAGLSGYAASKGAIVAFTKALAVEVAPKGIRVNAICPGWVDTSFNAPAIEYMGGGRQFQAALSTVVPMGRQGTVEEIANGIAFLSSDASSYMTGQALVIDGGVL